MIGAARIGTQAWIGDEAVIRADGQAITLGGPVLARPPLDGAYRHAHPRGAGRDGSRSGANSVVHACTVGSDVVIEDDVVILDGAEIGDHAVIEAGATVFPA